MSVAKARVAVLISGTGSNMVSLIEAGQAPDAPYEVVLVVSNIASAAGLDKARALGVQAVAVEHAPSARIERRTNAPWTPCCANMAFRSWPWPVICAC